VRARIRGQGWAALRRRLARRLATVFSFRGSDYDPEIGRGFRFANSQAEQDLQFGTRLPRQPRFSGGGGIVNCVPQQLQM